MPTVTFNLHLGFLHFTVRVKASQVVELFHSSPVGYAFQSSWSFPEPVPLELSSRGNTKDQNHMKYSNYTKSELKSQYSKPTSPVLSFNIYLLDLAATVSWPYPPLSQTFVLRLIFVKLVSYNTPCNFNLHILAFSPQIQLCIYHRNLVIPPPLLTKLLSV